MADMDVKKLEKVFQASGRPISFKEIIVKAGLTRPEARSLKRVLRNMTTEGKIIRTRSGLYGQPVEMSLVTGHLQAHRDGYGFVISEKSGERDVFIPPRGMGGAMDGDRVIVRIESLARREGKILRILTRAHTRLAGTIEISKSGSFVKPKNKSFSFVIYIAPKDRGEAKDGQSVLVELIEYPLDRRPATGKVVKVIERPGDPKAEADALVEEFNLPRKFPTAVISEAKSLYNIKDDSKRKDLRSLVTCTIDGERARDFDDAVSVAKTHDGYKLYVHIADVGFYVDWESALDLEARGRGTSVYFPDRVIPMLPHELSEDLASLKPHVDRMTVTVEMDFSSDGSKTGSAFYPSVIKSTERMTYTSVNKIVTLNDNDERLKYNHILKDLEMMSELAKLLRQKRLQRGSLDFDLPEPEVILGVTGIPEAIVKAQRNSAHMLIEDFMISANEAVAEFLTENEIPCVYRVHEPPDEMKLDDIWKTIRPLLRHKEKPIKSKSLTPMMFSMILEDVKGSPAEEAMNYIILRSMKQARYSTDNAGHFGLASECYLHFTSPIRRYPDLIVHRVLKEFLGKKRLSEKRIAILANTLPDIAAQASRLERIASDAEYQAVNAMRVWFMKDKVGGEFPSRVIGVSPHGIKIRLEEFYVEGFIRISELSDDFYVFDEKALLLVGKHTRRSFKMGDEIVVTLDRVNMDERELVFGIKQKKKK